MSDRSMGVLQEADEERKRRMENPDDWPQNKARLTQDAKYAGSDRFAQVIAADIRAALQRVEELEEQRAAFAEEMLRWHSHADAADKRVEELEQELAEQHKMTGAWCVQAEAAEAKLARVEELERQGVEAIIKWSKRAEAAEAELAEYEKHARIDQYRDNALQDRAVLAEAKLAKVIFLADDHGFPFYAYGDNEAAVEMSHRLEQILAAAKGE